MAPVYYHLGKFPPVELDWPALVPLIGRANAALARYDGLLLAIPEASVLLSPLTTQEAVLSSRIEGTQATMGEVLELQAGGDPAHVDQPKRDDAEEILNYRAALTMCAKAVEERPLSQHLLREAHAMLMRGVRGRDKSPGEFRKHQNWIGPKGCSIEKASFVPIPQDHLQTGLDHLSDYMASAEELDGLVQLAIIHVEFEALHPFDDGNGRLGRMLIPLFLYQRKLLGSPNFYMSGYLEAHGDAYRERMRAVSRDGAWTAWCGFFLQGIAAQAADNERKARAILALYERTKLQVVDLTHSQHAIRAIDFLFQYPIFGSGHFLEGAEIPKPTAARILTLLRDAGILATLREGRGRRGGIFMFRELLETAESEEGLLSLSG
jgi:Fic family protein